MEKALGITTRSTDDDLGFVRQRFSVLSLWPGLLVLLSAVPVAFLFQVVDQRFNGQPERAVLASLVLAGTLVGTPPLLYAWFTRRKMDPGAIVLVALAAVCGIMAAIYFARIAPSIRFPADILIWSESDFVNDIIKFRVGYPIFSAQVNNESNIYLPGSQLLTYAIAWLFGGATSIPLYRLIQVGYTLLSAVLAAICCGRLAYQITPTPLKRAGIWAAVSTPILYLIATNSLTNPFTHYLHNDALAQLVSIAAFLLLVEWSLGRRTSVLVLMALIPTLGFYVKQSLAIWAVLYVVYLALFDQQRSWKRLFLFSLATFGVLALGYLLGWVLWGENFYYWGFQVLGGRGVSPLRALQHGLKAWAYFAAGILGGMALLRGKDFARFFGLWLVWLLFFAVETYTSGIAWMMNHMGPGSLIAGIWFLAGLTRLWPPEPSSALRPDLPSWYQAGAAVAAVALLLNGWGTIRIPLNTFPSDAYRYVAEIEQELQDLPPGKVLLDQGSWWYLQNNIVMKDRSVPFGDRGYNGTGDFSGMIRRLQEKQYDRILVRNLHSPDFVYDHWMFIKSSGIRAALLENYQEVDRIRAVEVSDLTDSVPNGISPNGISEISILEPKP